MMKRNSQGFKYLIILLLMVSTSSFASVSFHEVLEHAVGEFAQVVVAGKDRQIAEADQLVANGGFDWNLRSQFNLVPKGYYEYRYWDAVASKPLGFLSSRFNLGYRRGFGLLPVYEEKLRTTLGGEVFFGLDFSLLRNRDIDSLRGSLQKAQIGVSLQNASFRLSQLETARQVVQKYWDWFNAYHRVNIQKELLKIAQDRNNALIERVRRGDLPKFEQIDNARVIFQRSSDVVSAERLLQKITLELTLYFPGIDFPVEELATPDLPIDQKSYELAESSLSEIHPELLRLQYQREQVTVDQKLASNLNQPKLDVQFQGAQDLGTGPKSLTPFAVEIKVGLELPLQNRALQGREIIATIQGERIEVQNQLAKNRLKLALKDAFQSVMAQYERLRLAREEKKMANQLEQGERVRFQSGESSMIFVNLREQSNAEARIREAQAYSDYQKSRYEYLLAVGNISALK
jgi:hypothetical protein